MELHLVDLRISLLIAANQIGEMQESSRACERALLVVAAQSALRAARLSVAAVQEATGEAQVALGRAEAASHAGDARAAAEALADVCDVIAPMSDATSARIDVTEALILWCLSRVEHRNQETLEQSVTEAFRRPPTSDVIARCTRHTGIGSRACPADFPPTTASLSGAVGGSAVEALAWPRLSANRPTIPVSVSHVRCSLFG